MNNFKLLISVTNRKGNHKVYTGCVKALLNLPITNLIF
jgi:hypothetical protein